MKFRVRDIKSKEVREGLFMGQDGRLYNRVLECVGGVERFLIEPYLFKDKNQKEVYVNDRVILEETGKEYCVKLSPSLGIVLEDVTPTLSPSLLEDTQPIKNKSSDFVLKEEKK